MSEQDLRPELPEMPTRIAMLRRHRGYPVPWFVADIDGEPDFRVIKPNAIAEGWVDERCWVCGGKTGAYVAFAIGPMCAVNRVTAEPPSHRECAVWSAIACPFLTRPHAKRREGNRPEDAVEPAGVHISRNPGAVCVWISKRSHANPFRAGDTGVLFNVGEPEEVLWFREGRPAMREEVLESINSGIHILHEAAESDGDRALRTLDLYCQRAHDYLPPGEGTIAYPEMIAA